jgi:hypothetical protein
LESYYFSPIYHISSIFFPQLCVLVTKRGRVQTAVPTALLFTR